MKSSRLAFGLAALVLAAFPISGLAQVAGFQAGIAQPRAVIPPVQAPVVAVNGTFRGVPNLMPPFQPPPFPGIQVPLVPNFPTLIMPNTTLVPGQTFVLPPVFVQPPLLVVPTWPVALPSLPATPVNRPPLFGMSRVELLRHMGQPMTTVITSTGETLYFPSGVIVIIQNGQVVSPR